MSVLGMVEVIDAGASFASEASGPVAPGTPRFDTGSSRRPSQQSDDGISSVIASNAEATLIAAQNQAESVASSTTLAGLAIAYEASEHRDKASEVAREVLALCAKQSDALTRTLLDPLAAQIALEVLFRSGHADDAVQAARRLNLSTHLSLTVGANLASLGRIADAHSFIDGLASPERDAILGFVFTVEGDNHKAVTHLRAALRRTPDDADSAMNLSIVLWRLGSRKKALSAALQATHVAPSRMDAVLHYLELLIADRQFVRVDGEVKRLLDMGISAPARLLIMQARAKLGLEDQDGGARLLERAATAARQENDDDTVAEVRSNLIRLKALRGKITRDEGVKQLTAMHDQYSSGDVVVINLAQVASRKHHVAALSKAFEDVKAVASPARTAFIEYQIATLKGDTSLAGERALAWLDLEPENPHAIFATMVALGIGLERWADALEVAKGAVDDFPEDLTLINNAGYVFAMAGMSDEAIRMLTPHAEDDFVIRATLGLAYLSKNDIATGMKMYRQAANEAEKRDDESRSLMTAYQALVVRQLGLLESNDAEMISAVSLPPVALPDDWTDRPEFLRLFGIAERHGYPWPLAL